MGCWIRSSLRVDWRRSVVSTVGSLSVSIPIGPESYRMVLVIFVIVSEERPVEIVHRWLDLKGTKESAKSPEHLRLNGYPSDLGSSDFMPRKLGSMLLLANDDGSSSG